MSPALEDVDIAVVDELEIVAVLVELRDVLVVAPDPLLRQQDVGQHDLAELRLADEAPVVLRVASP